MPDDAMDLNDEGVEAAAKAISNVRYTAARQRANGQFVDEQDEFKRMALAAAPYLRAVAESDELAMERATTVAEAAQEWQDANDAIGEADGGDPDISTMLHRRRIAVHVLRQALYVWKLNLLSPDEAAGGE